ncbi:MAG: hypothetical protein NTW21_39250 [Verrucomicrobia bacterium]|nr:hypothetical protein [Verrucomicrobiota bacterium]
MRNVLIVSGVILTALSGHGRAEGLIYAPQGDAIVIENGTRWNNRPLYCHERFPFVWAGEMPSLKGEMGILYAGIERGGVRVPLQQFATRIMRYRPGRMEWECRDPRFPGLAVRLLGTTLADANGFTARLAVTGSQAGDRALWCVFPPTAEAGAAATVRTSPHGYESETEPANPLAHVRARLSHPVPRWETITYAEREDFTKATPLDAAGSLKAAGLLAGIPLSDGTPQAVAVACDEANRPAVAAVAEAAKAFELGMARAEDFSARLVIDTPDPYLNAGAPASVAAAAGLFVDPTFVHGGSQWRMRMPGWRTMGGATYYGWIDQIRRALAYWGKLQVPAGSDKTRAEFSPTGCEQVGNSRFFGAGFINYPDIPQVYEFQTQFFDDAVRAWRASADPALEKMLRPMLELHLERCRACFDPDGDGIYESYNNTWPNDSIWFNGGGTPEQSGYVYYGHRAAADMCQRAGDPAGAAKHSAIAASIKQAVNKLLWMPERGQFASYVESSGHQRQMPDAWVYAQHIPIETGLATPEQAWKAMFYTEWAMERFKLPYGEMRQTSNFVPGQWSIRELYHGDNFAMALGYFLAGQGDEGWNLLRGAMLESMYGDGVPKSGFSQESGHFNRVNYISPGGLSHPNCAIDFIDIVTPYARALVEGLFGFRPDFPNGIVRMEPSFPSSWDRASIKTPEFALAFKDRTYQLTLTQPAAVRFGIPVRSAKVKGVTVNGQPADFTIEPWAGYGMLRVAVPATRLAVLQIDTEGPSNGLSAIEEEQGGDQPGHQLVLKKLDGEVPRYQLVKVHVLGKVNPKVLREAPAAAKWQPLDISAALNADLRTIFKQRYASPRPDRVSMRVAYDGWGAWTFSRFWGIATPEIGMEKALGPEAPAGLIQDGQLVTPQHARFRAPGPDMNIAFTSLWDNWPQQVTVPVNHQGEAVWLLVSGSTTPMQGKIANAVVRFNYADGQQEALDLVPPENFWSLCKYGNVDYNYERDGFSLPKEAPPTVQLGTNCRAMVYGWKLRPGVELKEITLETLSQDVVIGLMAASIMNPASVNHQHP